MSRAGPPEADAAGRRAWVFRIARNLALNHVRDHRHDNQAGPIVDVATPAVQELAAAIRQAVGALSDVDRDVFLLRESAGLSYEEIAAACDLTVDAVRSRLKRARLSYASHWPDRSPCIANGRCDSAEILHRVHRDRIGECHERRH